MSKIVIKKHVSLAVIGEDYKDAYVELRAIAVSEFENALSEIDKAKTNAKKVLLMLELVKERFLGGKFPNDKGELEDLAKEDLDGLDGEGLAECFRAISGQPDPKASTTSTSSSPTAETPPSTS